MSSDFNPYISVDCVIFGFEEMKLKVLLIERRLKQKNKWVKDLKLPGDLIMEDESLDESAYRVLSELTGLNDIFLKQFYTFGNPHRINDLKDINWLSETSRLSIKRVVTVAYYSLVNIQKVTLNKDIKYHPRWIDINNIPVLPFDHHEIIVSALDNLKNKLPDEPIVFELLPKKFTLRQLQVLYEQILHVTLDNRNFRKKILQMEFIQRLDEKEKNVSHKPAHLYRFNKRKYQNYRKRLNIINK